MKWRTNRQREARKLRKAIEVKNDKSKQLHINYNRKFDYHTIISLVKAGSSILVLKNNHTRRKIEKEVLKPKVIWNQGTYITKKHGEIGSRNRR